MNLSKFFVLLSVLNEPLVHSPLDFSSKFFRVKILSHNIKLYLELFKDFIDSSTLQDYDTKLLRLEVNYTDDSEGKTSYLFSNTTDNKYGLQSMSKPWIVLMNYQANDQPLFITTSRKTLSAIPLKVTATENEAITKLTFNQSFSSNTNLTLDYGYLGTVNTRGDTG